MGELKEPVVPKTKSYWVCFQRCPYWLTGESSKDVWARRKAPDTSVDSQRYPDDYPGRIVSVVDGSKPRPGWTKGELIDAIKMDLTPAQYSDAASRRVKVNPVGWTLTPIGLEDRFGAATSALIARYTEAQLIAAKESTPSPEDVQAMETQMAISTEISKAIKTLPACGDAVFAVERE